MPKSCVSPPEGAALWARVEGLLNRRDGAGQALVERISNNSEIQELLAKQLGYALQPGTAPLAPICSSLESVCSSATAATRARCCTGLRPAKFTSRASSPRGAMSAPRST